MKLRTLLLLFLPAIPFFLPSFHSFITMYQAMAFQVVFAYLLLGLYLLIKERWNLCLLCMGNGITIFLFILLPFYDLPDQTGQQPDLKVAHFNVLKSNGNHQATITAAMQSKAILISFQEVTAPWASALEEGLCESYPYYWLEPQEGSYGIAMFSKLPIDDLNSICITGMPNVTGEIKVNNHPIRFISTHALTPVTPTFHRGRNEHIRGVAALANSYPTPQLVMGDFNTVPWDSVLDEFKHTTQLADSRKTLAPTYPSWFGAAQIPIDFIFHSPQLHCTQFTTIKSTSSDHYGVAGEFRVM